MSGEDKKTFVGSVPKNFFARDEALHELSAGIAQAARDKDKPLQRKLYADMVEACTGCHSGTSLTGSRDLPNLNEVVGDPA